MSSPHTKPSRDRLKSRNIETGTLEKKTGFIANKKLGTTALARVPRKTSRNMTYQYAPTNMLRQGLLDATQVTRSKQSGLNPKILTPLRQRMPSKRMTKHELLLLTVDYTPKKQRENDKPRTAPFRVRVSYLKSPPSEMPTYTWYWYKRSKPHVSFFFFLAAIICGGKRCVCRGRHKQKPHPYRLKKTTNPAKQETPPAPQVPPENAPCLVPQYILLPLCTVH